MKIQSLGHVVIKVRSQQRAEAFYNRLLGIPIAARYPPLSINTVELYIDASDVWKQRPEAVAQIPPLDLK